MPALHFSSDGALLQTVCKQDDKYHTPSPHK